jgi:transposase
VSDILQMSKQEISRAQVLEQLVGHQIKQGEAAARLGLSVRQVKRLKQTYLHQGAKALISKKRCQRSNHQLDPQIQAQAIRWLKSRYADFGPTFAHQKLTEIHHLALSVETVRHLMIQADLWHPKRAHQPTLHPLRERRARFGELVQIDGSPYAWFEDRAPACVLLVFIDDATGRLGALRFTEAETTFSYFEVTDQYLRQWGKPLAFYSDKLGVFRVNLPNDLGGSGTTQFTRAMHQLGIDVLYANTPQAKGRVERVHQTLQDRLVKEMRLRGLGSLAAGNAYLPEFIADFNARFAVVPRESLDAHQPLLPQDDLGRILTVQAQRTLSKNLTLNYQNVIYQIQTTRPGYALRHAHVNVCEDHLGAITIEYKGKPLAYTVYRAQAKQAAITSSKQLNAVVDQLARTRTKKRKAYIPPPEHPWRRFHISHKSQSDAPNAAG